MCLEHLFSESLLSPVSLDMCLLPHDLWDMFDLPNVNTGKAFNDV